MQNVFKIIAVMACLGAAMTASGQTQNSFFGYTFRAPLDGADGVIASIGQVSTSHVFAGEPTTSIVQEVNAARNLSGPVVVGILGLIFNPTKVSGINCTHYERGGLSETKNNYTLRGDYQHRLDQFFATNAAIFQGAPKVIALSVHPEVNNNCVQSWKISVAANYVRSKLDEVATYGPIYIAAAYDLGSLNGSGRGFPVTNGISIGSQQAAKFPSGLDVIAYFAYDVFNPSQPSHPLNVGSDPWSNVSSKLSAALFPHQMTIGVLKGFCAPQPPSSSNIESLWGVNCPKANSTVGNQPNPDDHPPFQSLWKIGIANQNWSTYLLNDPRNVGVLMFNWRSSANNGDYFWGTGLLPELWSVHASIAAQWAPTP